MTVRTFSVLAAFGSMALGACQTAPTSHSGFLSTYDGVSPPGGSMRAAVAIRRDDQASDAVERVFIQPAAFAPNVGAEFSEGERLTVLNEVDRQICYEISRRFTVIPEAETEAATIRTWVVRLDPTGRFGSGVSAAANFFNPIPFLNVRTPGTTGGIAIESEMLAPQGGAQIAAITWGRNATVIGTDSPSFSRVGDALQFAGPMGDAVAEAFASEERDPRAVPDPDPCAHYGPRRNIAGSVVGIVSGLYIPEVERPRTPEQ